MPARVLPRARKLLQLAILLGEVGAQTAATADAAETWDWGPYGAGMVGHLVYWSARTKNELEMEVSYWNGGSPESPITTETNPNYAGGIWQPLTQGGAGPTVVALSQSGQIWFPNVSTPLGENGLHINCGTGQGGWSPSVGTGGKVMGLWHREKVGDGSRLALALSHGCLLHTAERHVSSCAADMGRVDDQPGRDHIPDLAGVPKARHQARVRAVHLVWLLRLLVDSWV